MLSFYNRIQTNFKETYHRKGKGNFVMKRSWRGQFSLRRGKISKSTVNIVKCFVWTRRDQHRALHQKMVFCRVFIQPSPCLSPKQSLWSKFFLLPWNSVTELLCSHRFWSQKNGQKKIRLCLIHLEDISRGFPGRLKSILNFQFGYFYIRISIVTLIFLIKVDTNSWINKTMLKWHLFLVVVRNS